MKTVAWILLLVSTTAYAQSDEQILETVRANAEKIYLEQASSTLPESFHKSGLTPSDKQSVIEQWANASADCLADALAEYAESAGIPLAELVAEDGSFSLKGGPEDEFQSNLSTCIERAWEGVGTDTEY